MNLEREIKINKILLILLITLSVGTIALRTSHAMFSKKETFNNVLRIITGSELPGKGVVDDLKSSDGFKGINSETGALCTSDCKEYRYTGANVNNYVKLNNNGQDELWRIIGVFTDEDNGEKYMRIVRNSVLPESYLPTKFVIDENTYDIKQSGVNAYWNSGGSSNNDWSQAGLQYYLNKEKDSGSNKGYMSYLSDNTKNMLRETMHYLGTYEHKVDTTITSYNHERDIKSCVNNTATTSNQNGCYIWSKNKATWTGSISLMYPSDYGFSADSSYWSNTKLFDYQGTNIRTTSWMYTSMADFKDNTSWLISASQQQSYYATQLLTSGYVGNTNVIRSVAVRPVLNLKSVVKITNLDTADGSMNKPYELGL